MREPEENPGILLSTGRPALLATGEEALLIESGSVDVFLVQKNADGSFGRRENIGSFTEAGLLFGFDLATHADSLAIMAIGGSDTKVRQLDLDSAFALENFQSMLRHWITVCLPAFDDETLENELGDDASLFDDLAAVTAQDINKIQRVVLSYHLRQIESSNQQLKARQNARIENDNIVKEHSLESLASGFTGQKVEDTPALEDLNFQAFWHVCNAIDASVNSVKNPRADAKDYIQQLARASSVPVRRVLLRGRWWQEESQPLLGFLEDKNQAVALLPYKDKGYICVNPSDGSRKVVSGDMLESLEATAFMPYRTLPDTAVNANDLLRFSLHGARSDLLRILLFGILGGLLGLAVPIATRIVFDDIVPAGDRAQLLELAIAIALIGITTGAVQVVQGLGVLRIESRAGHNLQTAVWDRLVRLPVNFFNRFSTGDIVQRAFAVDQIREHISTTMIRTILHFLFSIFSFGLMFYYDARLAIWACLIIAVSIGVTLATGLMSIKIIREQQRLEGKLGSLVLQCISGIEKIRVTAAESRAFAQWSRPFSTSRLLAKGAQRLAYIDRIYTAVLPIICSMLIFYFIAQRDANSALSTGTFLAFNAAFATVLASFFMISNSFVMIAQQLPVYQRMLPIMQEEVETTQAAVDPGIISGKLEVQDLHFRYNPEDKNILNGISFKASLGEFIALVGTSGSGKSTLFRILLGFETPQLGTVSFDGKNITSLDKQELRNQIGVVLQSGSIMPGSIYTNIIGSADLSIEQAWEAARMAGFDRDIETMPMGMHTIISDGGGGLSGGQAQRLQIARAFVRKPKILFFDEATSALDNTTQTIVTNSMNELNATRLVIAHRLSTIEDADKILVLDEGNIAEQGSYQELLDKQGIFYQLVQRQLS